MKAQSVREASSSSIFPLGSLNLIQKDNARNNHFR